MSPNISNFKNTLIYLINTHTGLLAYKVRVILFCVWVKVIGRLPSNLGQSTTLLLLCYYIKFKIKKQSHRKYPNFQKTKWLLIAIITLLITVDGFSQRRRRRSRSKSSGSQLVIKGGLNTSQWYSGHRDPKTIDFLSSTNGVYISAGYKYPINSNISIVPNMAYSQEGFTQFASKKKEILTHKYKVNMLDIPLELNYTTNNGLFTIGAVLVP